MQPPAPFKDGETPASEFERGMKRAWSGATAALVRAVQEAEERELNGTDRISQRQFDALVRFARSFADMLDAEIFRARDEEAETDRIAAGETKDGARGGSPDYCR
jgi:hypothetical protein